VDRLIDAFAALPGIGRRSAERLALHILKNPPEEAGALASALLDVQRSVRHCTVCWNLAGEATCTLCADASRDRATLLVVEQPRDLLAIEKAGFYRGLFHVLMGRLSPLEGIGPDALTIAELLDRVRDPAKNAGGVRVREVILGLNPTLEGDGTALYLAEELRTTDVTVTRLARGLASGSALETANLAVLGEALRNRQPHGSTHQSR
jgi:recombination protein RecR